MQGLKEIVRDVPDFPKEGIIYKDITPLLRDPVAFARIIDLISEKYESQGVDVVIGAEARGFILGAAIAYKLQAGFVPARKPGKLPHKVTKAEYELEYGIDSLEVHEDAITTHQKVLIVDDVLATGGTAKAKIELVEQLGGTVVGIAFLIELGFLGGRSKLGDFDVFSLITYE